ncbi:unnamed protein product, partial [Gulo gulo]
REAGAGLRGGTRPPFPGSEKRERDNQVAAGLDQCCGYACVTLRLRGLPHLLTTDPSVK